MPLTPAQCRAARALLDWTQDELAERAEVSRGTIRGFESGQHMLQRSTAAAVRRALVAGGVALVEADRDGGHGVRLIEPLGASAEDGSACDQSTLQRSASQADCGSDDVRRRGVGAGGASSTAVPHEGDAAGAEDHPIIR